MIGLKEEILAKLEKAKTSGLVDEEVIPLLDAMNGISGAVTTSSCSGRYQLIQVPDLGDKVGSSIIGKWHREVSEEELLEAFDLWNGTGQLHLLVQPLLVHVRCRDLRTGAALRNLAQEMGLKFSTIRSLRMDRNGDAQKWGVVVEFLGTERMEVPLHGIDREYIEFILPPLVKHGNELIKKTKSHIGELTEALLKFDGSDRSRRQND